MPLRRYRFFLVLALIFLTCAPSWGQAPQPRGAVVDSVAQDRSSVTLFFAPDSTPKTYAVPQGDLRAYFGQMHKRDKLTIYAADNTIQAIVLEEANIDVSQRLVALAVTAIGWLLIGLLLAKGDVLKLIISEDNRYSNSKFQAVLWFSVFLVIYASALALRALRLGIAHMPVNIPQHLLLLSGLSAFTFGAAKGVTTTKVQNAVAAGNPTPKGGWRRWWGPTELTRGSDLERCWKP